MTPGARPTGSSSTAGLLLELAGLLFQHLIHAAAAKTCRVHSHVDIAQFLEVDMNPLPDRLID
jgi:hypothetical protein